MSLSTQKSFTFPKTARLLTTQQFRRVNKQGKLIKGKFLTIQICESRNSCLKLGLTVSRKFGKAVRRNRFKRLVREAFRLSQYELPQDLHLNIRPTLPAALPSLEEIRAEIIHCVQLITEDTCPL